MKRMRILFSIFLRIIGRLILKSFHLSYNVSKRYVNIGLMARFLHFRKGNERTDVSRCAVANESNVDTSIILSNKEQQESVRQRRELLLTKSYWFGTPFGRAPFFPVEYFRKRHL